MTQSHALSFKPDPESKRAFAALSPCKRFWYVVLAVVAVLPLFFLIFLMGSTRSLLWTGAFQLASASGLFYIRWRSPEFHGGLLILCTAIVGCLGLVAAAIAV
jgi:hypothetical protein